MKKKTKQCYICDSKKHLMRHDKKRFICRACNSKRVKGRRMRLKLRLLAIK